MYSTMNEFSIFLNANFTKWSNTLKQFVGKLSTNCSSVFDHFVGLALKGLSGYSEDLEKVEISEWFEECL